MPDAPQFNTDRTHPGRWTITFDSFDREALGAAKAQLNRFGTPTATELQSSNDVIFSMLALPSAQARRAKIGNIGYGLRSDFELNFGRYLTSFGRADDDDADTRPDTDGQRPPAPH